MLLARKRDLETVTHEDVWEAVDPAARHLVLLDVVEERVCLWGGKANGVAGVGELGFDLAAVGGVGFVPLEVAVGFWLTD